jgi:hypothetical protein
MPFQPYPSGGDQVSPQVTSGPAPQSVQNAVKLMYAGAALSVLSIIATAVTANNIRPYIEKHIKEINGKPVTAQQITSLVHFDVAAGIAVAVIGLALWLWMAWKNGQGRSWARIVSTVLFALYAIFFLLDAVRAGGSSAFALITAVLTLLVGLGSVFFLWKPTSSAYFTSLRR